jgi:hypothetical protein
MAGLCAEIGNRNLLNKEYVCCTLGRNVRSKQLIKFQMLDDKIKGTNASNHDTLSVC